MLRCKDIIRLISSHDDAGWMKRAELKMHLLMCEHCGNYARQLKIMKESFSKLFSKTTQVDRNTVTELEQEVLRRMYKK